MKGYCPVCSKDMDEVDYLAFGMCDKCFEKTIFTIKYKHLRVRKGNIDYFYTCNTMEWNYYLNRYYPKAVQIMTIEHLNREVNIKLT